MSGKGYGSRESVQAPLDHRVASKNIPDANGCFGSNFEP
jgi:hypothetical protein